MDPTRFDWDDANIEHIAEHGIAPDEAEETVTSQPIIVEYQNYNSEPRERIIGETLAGRACSPSSSHSEIAARESSRHSRQTDGKECGILT